MLGSHSLPRDSLATPAHDFQMLWGCNCLSDKAVFPFPHLVLVSVKASPSAERHHRQLSSELQSGGVLLCVNLQAHSDLVEKTSKLCPVVKLNGWQRCVCVCGLFAFLQVRQIWKTYEEADRERPKAAKFSPHSGAQLQSSVTSN